MVDYYYCLISYYYVVVLFVTVHGHLLSGLVAWVRVHGSGWKGQLSNSSKTVGARGSR